MSTETGETVETVARQEAFRGLASSAANNIPGVAFVSITLNGDDDNLRTIASTDVRAEQMDALQYELREGPCYAAVTDERFVLVNDLAGASDYPNYGARAVDSGVRAQAAIQLLHNNGERAGLNLYALEAEAFDGSTVQIAELFAAHAASLLEYAEQVEQLDEALHTRTDIGIAIGILMERFGLSRDQAFGFLVRNSSHQNVKVRLLAQQVIDGTFKERATPGPPVSRASTRSMTNRGQ